MKKLISAMILLLMAMLFVTQPTYAALSSPNDIADELQWQRITLDGKYAVRTLRFEIDFAEVDRMEFSTTLSGWENFITENVAGTYSRVDIYNAQSFGTPIKTYPIIFEGPGANEMLFFSDGLGGWSADVSAYTGKWMQITLMMNPTAPVSLINNVEYWMNNYRDLYDFNIEVRYEINAAQTVADLPLTIGNPQQENPGKMGEVLDYYYDGPLKKFFATVRYYEEYNIVIDNINFSDDFMDSVAGINYYSIGSEKFFQFDFIDSEEVIITISGEYATQWTGFAIWNLTTNEFVLYNRALALTYIDVEPDRDVFGYLYLPNIPIDDMLSVAGFFNYRFGYKNLIQQQKYHDWEQATFVLEKDEASYGSDIFNYGLLPQWSYNAIKWTSLTNPVAFLFTMIPGLQDVGYFLNYTGRYSGYLAFALTTLGGIDRVRTGKIDEIETIQPDITLRAKLNQYYTKALGETVVLPTSVDIHKLYFGAFTAYNTNVVNIDADSLTYTEITWVTNGQIYTLPEGMIDEYTAIDEEDIAPPEDTRTPIEAVTDWLKALIAAIFNSDVAVGIRIAIAVAIGVVSIWIIVQISSFLKKAKKTFKNPVILIGLGVLILALLFGLGFLIL